MGSDRSRKKVRILHHEGGAHLSMRSARRVRVVVLAPYKRHQRRRSLFAQTVFMEINSE